MRFVSPKTPGPGIVEIVYMYHGDIRYRCQVCKKWSPSSLTMVNHLKQSHGLSIADIRFCKRNHQTALLENGQVLTRLADVGFINKDEEDKRLCPFHQASTEALVIDLHHQEQTIEYKLPGPRF